MTEQNEYRPSPTEQKSAWDILMEILFGKKEKKEENETNSTGPR